MRRGAAATRPAEVPELQAAVSRYVAAMTDVSRELLELCADALGLDSAGVGLGAMTAP